MSTQRRWSREFDHCLGCSTTDRRHAGRGYCDRCYRSRYDDRQFRGTVPHQIQREIGSEIEADDAYRVSQESGR